MTDPHYSERLKARAERIGASLHKRCPDASRAAINEETRTSFDVYQWDGQSSAVAGIGPIATDSRDLSPERATPIHYGVSCLQSVRRASNISIFPLHYCWPRSLSGCITSSIGSFSSIFGNPKSCLISFPRN